MAGQVPELRVIIATADGMDKSGVFARKTLSACKNKPKERSLLLGAMAYFPSSRFGFRPVVA